MKVNTIYLAGGCFWGVQKFLDQFDGIIETEVGYANGATSYPSYEDVCHGSGHAETVKVVYDTDLISLETLLEHYFRIIDPISVNRQGNDIGVQYRTGIYYVDEEDSEAIENYLAIVQSKYDRLLAVEVKGLEAYYPAEEYHQKYLDKNPGGYCHIPGEMLRMKQ